MVPEIESAALNPVIWVYLYLAELLLLSMAMGCLTLHQPRILRVPRLSRFLIGFCVSPFLLGTWMIVLASLWPAASRWAFLISPSLLAIIVLALYGRRSLHRLVHSLQRSFRSLRTSWPHYVVYIAAATVLLLVTTRLVLNFPPPIRDHDALAYLGEALPFALERTPSTINTFRGAPDGTQRGDAHGFLFPAFLSHALMTNASGVPGYPNDLTVRAAFQVLFIYMLLSIAALAGTARLRGLAALAIIAVLQVPQLELLSVTRDRDAFRIIPLMLLATFLAGLSPQSLRHRMRPTLLLPAIILVAYAQAAHNLGGLIVATIALAWAIWSLWGGARWQNVLLVLVAMGVGIFLGGGHFVVAYLETGSIYGDNVFEENAIAGTPLWDAKDGRFVERLQGTGNIVDRLIVLLGRDRYRLSMTGLVAAALVLAFGIRPGQRKPEAFLLFPALMVFAVALPFTGLFDFVRLAGKYRMTEMFVGNTRYALHWYPFAAVCLAMMVAYGYKPARYPGKLSRIAGTVALISFTLIMTGSAIETVVSKWRVPEGYGTEQFLRHVNLHRAAGQIIGEKRILIEDNRYNYYLGSNAVLMYARPTWPIVGAQSEDELRGALQKLDIGAVVLDRKSISGWWDLTLLFDFVNNPDNTVLIQDEQFNAYLLVANEQERNSILAAYSRGIQELPGPPYEITATLGQTYQTPLGEDVAFNFLDHLDQAAKISADNSSHIRRSVFMIDHYARGVISQHPPSRIAFQVSVPVNAVLDFALALAPEASHLGKGDGVQFEIEVDEPAGTRHRVFSEYIDPKNVPAHRKWNNRVLDLSPWSGQVVTLTLSTGPGPNGDDRYDWAGWGEPRILQSGNTP